MKLVINNVGRVSSADIVLGGITVLAGANGTGKSTVSRSLMTISSISRRINSLILAERGKSIVATLQEAFKKVGGDIFYTDQSFGGRNGSWLQCLNVAWWSDAGKVVEWLKEHNRQEVMVFPTGFLDRPACLEAIEEARPKIIEALNRSDDEYVAYICRKLFKKAFNGQLSPVFDSGTASLISVEDDEKTDSRISVDFSGGEVKSYREIGRTYYPSVVYFEPLNFVDFVNNIEEPISDRYSAGGLCSCFVVQKEPPKDISLEEQKELDDANEIVQEIVANIHGRLIKDNADIKFNETFSTGTSLIDVKNIASGMKTMAAIVRAVENRSVRRGSLIIIDEPESNLHPEWQVAFARFLVSLSKRLDVSLLLNTHSPYFLQAIRVCSKQMDVASRYYNMEPTGCGDAYATADVTDDIDRVFRTMSKPFNDLIGS